MKTHILMSVQIWWQPNLVIHGTINKGVLGSTSTFDKIHRPSLLFLLRNRQSQFLDIPLALKYYVNP